MQELLSHVPLRVGMFLGKALIQYPCLLVLCIVSMIRYDTIRIVDTLIRYTICIAIRIVSFIKYKYCGDRN